MGKPPYFILLVLQMFCYAYSIPFSYFFLQCHFCTNQMPSFCVSIQSYAQYIQTKYTFYVCFSICGSRPQSHSFYGQKLAPHCRSRSWEPYRPFALLHFRFFSPVVFFVIFFFSTYLFRSAPFISSGMDETSRSHWIPTEKW